jgi:hypothetical protein
MRCSFTSTFGNFYHSYSPHHLRRHNATLSQGPKKIAAALGGGRKNHMPLSALITQRQKPFTSHQSLLHSSIARISSTTDYREWQAKNKRRERLTRSRRTRSSRFRRRGLRRDVSATPYLPFLGYFIFPSRSRDTFENVSVFSANLNTTPE